VETLREEIGVSEIPCLFFVIYNCFYFKNRKGEMTCWNIFFDGVVDMINAILIRNKSEKVQTLGRMIFFNGRLNILFHCVTIEPPWKENEKNVSCIPCGDYKVKHRISEKYGKHLTLIGVTNRTYILLHWGNYYYNTEGCIIVGNKHRDINADGNLDVVNSKKTFNKIMQLLKTETEINLKICYALGEEGE